MQQQDKTKNKLLFWNCSFQPKKKDWDPSQLSDSWKLFVFLRVWMNCCCCVLMSMSYSRFNFPLQKAHLLIVLVARYVRLLCQFLWIFFLLFRFLRKLLVFHWFGWSSEFITCSCFSIEFINEIFPVALPSFKTFFSSFYFFGCCCGPFPILAGRQTKGKS